MVWNVINAKLSYLRTLILKLASLTKICEDYDWMKPKLRNFTSKKRSERNGYVHQNGVRSTVRTRTAVRHLSAAGLAHQVLPHEALQVQMHGTLNIFLETIINFITPSKKSIVIEHHAFHALVSDLVERLHKHHDHFSFKKSY